jgi:hypothetical protein
VSAVWSRSAPGGANDEEGNAILEFIMLTALFLIPLTYLILAVFQVQGAAYGATEAARESGRAFVEAGSLDSARAQSCAAARIALHDQGAAFSDCATQLQISCVSEETCTAQLAPGTMIRAHLEMTVALPFLPSSIFGIPLTITVSATHDKVVDQYRAAR